MYINLRNKTASTSTLNPLNTSDALNSSAEDSRVDSNSSKRFSRKQNSNLDHNRSSKTPKNCQIPSKKQIDLKRITRTESQKFNYVNTGFIRQEEMFLKISHTPSKSSLYTPPMSTDRATQSTLFNGCTNSSPWEGKEIQTQKKKNFNDLEEQLDLKSGQIIMLEDQNMKLKGEISRIESEHLKLRVAQQKDHKEFSKKLSEQIQALKKQVVDKNEQIKQLRKSETILTRELKGIKYDKMLLEKQLQEIYKKRLPKQMRDLMSYREVSLTKQVEELKAELDRQKSQRQRSMEKQIGQLQHKHIQKESSIKKLQVYTHTLARKISDTQDDLKYKTQQFGKCFTELKQSNDCLLDQLKKTRKQNIKLRRLNIFSQVNKRKTYPSGDDSDTLSFSLSPRDSREL